jgi:hypothetical protein
MQTSSSRPRSGRRQLRLPTLLALTGACCLLLASTASAASVTFKPGFAPDRLGEGTVWSSELTFSGSEYDGSVAPLTELMVHLPAGVGGASAGFPVCEQATLEDIGPNDCPAGSMAGPQGSVGFEGKIGPNDIQETGIVQPFFAPDEKLLFFIHAYAPLDIEIVAQASYVKDTSPYGQVLTLELPLIEAVPGAPYVSITALTLHLGASHEEHGILTHSVTVPSECPAGGFPWAAAATFYEAGEPPDVLYTDPCPGSEGRTNTTTSLTVSNAAPVAGESVTYTATVTPAEIGLAPSGRVTFLDGGIPLEGCSAQPLSQGVSSSTATCQVSYPGAGSHQMSASYGGDVNYIPSASAVLPINVQPSSSSQTGGSSNDGSAGASGPTSPGTPPATTGSTPSPQHSPVPVVRPLTRAQQLAKALELCRREKSRSKRKTCESQARKQYKVKVKAKGKAKRG